MKLTDLKEAPYNPRTITQHALDGLTYSIVEFGDLSGIVWNKVTGHLVCGHQRLKSIKQKYGNQITLLEEGGQTALVVPDTDVYFKIRIVNWPKAKEKAANLAANATHITGAFTLDVNKVIDDVIKDMPEVASSLEFELLKILDNDEIKPLVTDDINDLISSNKDEFFVKIKEEITKRKIILATRIKPEFLNEAVQTGILYRIRSQDDKSIISQCKKRNRVN